MPISWLTFLHIIICKKVNHEIIVNIIERVWKVGSRDEICWIFGHVEHIGHCVQNVINSPL